MHLGKGSGGDFREAQEEIRMIIFFSRHIIKGGFKVKGSLRTIQIVRVDGTDYLDLKIDHHPSEEGQFPGQIRIYLTIEEMQEIIKKAKTEIQESDDDETTIMG